MSIKLPKLLAATLGLALFFSGARASIYCSCDSVAIQSDALEAVYAAVVSSCSPRASWTPRKGVVALTEACEYWLTTYVNTYDPQGNPEGYGVEQDPDDMHCSGLCDSTPGCNVYDIEHSEVEDA